MAIIFSRIRALGACFDVFPMSEPCARDLRDTRDADVYTAILLPSHTADAEVVMMEANIPSAAMALAGARFLLSVRGLPLEETEIYASGRIYKIVREDRNASPSIILAGCHRPHARRRMIIDTVTLELLFVSVDGANVCVSLCDDCDCFSVDSLLRVAYETREAMPCGVVAVSSHSGMIRAREYFVRRSPDNALIAARAAACACGLGALVRDARVTVAASTFSLSECDGGVAVSADDGPPYVLFTPDTK